ncbi:MAG: PEGA domain-containing protein [Candidatus Levyibacteriota bacterium]
MKKVLIIILPPLVAIIIFIVVTIVLNKNSNIGALQVTSTPQGKVYLNGKLLGDTPLCKCEQDNMLETGEYTIKIVPSDDKFSPFESKITISPSVLTVVDRTFGEGGLSQGSIIDLTPISNKKEAQILIVSFPDKASVYLDNNLSGTSPLLLKNITESDHEIKLSKEGYKEKAVRIRAIKGYKLESIVFLSINQDISASSSALPELSLTPSVSQDTIVILDTPTGFLRVRSDASINSSQITTVSPGEKYEVVSEQEGWFEIKLDDGKTGWVSSQYAKKDTSQ